MKRVGFPSLILATAILCVAALPFFSRSSAGDDAWRQLSLTDFIAEMERLTTGTSPPTDEQWGEIRSQSAERLLAIVDRDLPADYSDLVSLYLWAKPVLTVEQLDGVLAELNPTATQTSNWPFGKLKAVHGRMSEAEMPTASLDNLSLSWLEGRDVRTMEDIDQLGWLLEQVYLVDRRKEGPTAFTVQWTGTVTAPASGQYRFSLCPLALDVDHGRRQRQQTTSVSIASRQILDSATAIESDPVTLAGGQAVPIRVDLSFSCSDPAAFVTSPAVAILQWQTTAGNKQLVPSTSFRTPDGQQAGLLGQYVLQAGDQEERITRVDPQLDLVWYHGTSVAPEHGDLRQALTDQAFAVARRTSILATWESGQAAQKPDWIGANWMFLESLGASRQQSWAQTLLAHPVLLEDCPQMAAFRLYRVCRIGATNEALPLFGQWAQGNTNDQPAFTADFDQANRIAYRQLARMMQWQFPEHLESLEEDYLQLSDGSCSLPAAYTLAYGYWGQREISQWIDGLEARLDAPALSGDMRVNWLLARAQAEEIRRSRPGRFSRTTERTLAGEGWIQEAILVSKDEATRLRAHGELAARYATDEQLVGATAVLDQAQQRCTGSMSVQTLAKWRAELDTLNQVFQASRTKRETNARAAYVDRLRKRYRAAVDRGDSAATSRYERLLTDADGTD